jgi:hypothetical protein
VGWIRDSLYGPLHAIECGVFEPDEDISTWMLKDSEDNVFVSRYRGRQVDLERFWFSQGGNTIQSGMLPMVMIYLKRNQPEHATRSLFNGFAQNIYRDVRCFSEHPVSAFGIGFGPFYKTPDENCWINWLRNTLLMEKDDETLVIAPGAPRAWFADGESFSAEEMATYFGPMSYRVTSEAAKRRILIEIDPPHRNAPKWLSVRLRHPDGLPIKSITLNGSPYTEFNPADDTVTIPGSYAARIELIAQY